MSAQQDRIDREMLRSMAASFSSGLGFSFNREDMAELMQRMSERVDPKPHRADLCNTAARIAELEAEVARLRDDRDDAIDTLNAWFDRRKLAHEAIDETVLNAARGYLRTSRSGGMDKETSDMIEGVIEDMAQLAVFADLFARAALRDMEGSE